jgi:hypothetical protein
MKDFWTKVKETKGKHLWDLAKANPKSLLVGGVSGGALALGGNWLYNHLHQNA